MEFLPIVIFITRSQSSVIQTRIHNKNMDLLCVNQMHVPLISECLYCSQLSEQYSESLELQFIQCKCCFTNMSAENCLRIHIVCKKKLTHFSFRCAQSQLPKLKGRTDFKIHKHLCTYSSRTRTHTHIDFFNKLDLC